ncbi:hypothetical protein EB118_12640 [bacterium]|nr:hypothetical protein [bacterium]NDG30907.1 hypothetical protein [bacterium]
MVEKIELEDFSGGVTDYYLSAPPNKMRQCDNLLINQYQNQGKVFTRPGSRLYSAAAPRPIANRITTCFYYKDKLYIQSGEKLLYYKSSTSTWEEIPGRSGHNAFPGSNSVSGQPAHQFTYANWNYHTFIGNSSLPGYPMKVTVREGVPELVQAGLPKYDETYADRDSANVTKTYTDTIVTAGNFIVGKKYVIVSLGTTNFTLIGASSNTVGTQFTATGVGSGNGTAKRIFDTSYLYKLVFRRQYYSGSVEIQFLDVGSPSFPIELIGAYEIGLANDTLLLYGGRGFFPAIGNAAKTYWAGAEQAYYRWDAGTNTYIELISFEDIYPRIRNTITLSGIKTLTNTADTNWDVSSDLKIDIYRTLNNGTSYFLTGTINNGTTTFQDYVPDTIFPIKTYATKAQFPAQGEFNYLYLDSATGAYYIWYKDTNNLYSYIIWSNDSLDTQEQLYTNGGVVANDPPPKCRSMHIRSNVGYYGGLVENPYRLLQSIPNDIDSVPESFYVDVDDDIVAVSSTKNNVIILCKRKVYRVDGFFDELGRGGMVIELISDTAGCIGVNTPVQALDGVMWLGKDAVYFTDGFKVVKLNQDYDKTYKTFTSNDSRNLKYQGKYDSKKNRIWWTIQDESASDLNKCYVLDLNWGIRENSTFTTITGQSFVPAAIEFIDGDMIRCSDLGYVLIHKDDIYVDPKIDSSITPANWRSETIVYTLETSSYNFGTSAVRKYVTQANVTCDSTTNLSLRIVSNNDDDRIIADLLPIRSRGKIVWGEPDVYWGDYTLDWNKQGLIHEKRLMPAKSLRCNYKSLKFTNAHVAIVSSDIIGNAIVNVSLKQATLVNPLSKWITRSIGYFIAFEDDFTKEYEITGLSMDEKIITYSDPLGTSLNGSSKQWVIRGRPLGEVLNLLNLSIIYDVAGPSQAAYKVSNSGEAGTNQ